MKVSIFTDGACRGNPGIGGWGALLKLDTIEKSLYGFAEQTTNNRMELTAAIEGLAVLKYPCTVELYTDSKYLQQGMTEWLAGWKRRGWKNANKEPVKNIDLWQRLDTLNQIHVISWYWVKGHAGHPENERADALANQAIDEFLLNKG